MIDLLIILCLLATLAGGFWLGKKYQSFDNFMKNIFADVGLK